MKKFLIRLIGSLCLLGALAAAFLPGWVQMDGMNRREMRDLREEMLEDIANAENYVLKNLERDSFKDELKDLGLPSTKSAVKKRVKETETLLKELLDEDISLRELQSLSAKLPGYIDDCESLLELGGFSAIMDDAEDFESSVDALTDAKSVFTIISVAFWVFIGLGILSAVTHMLDEVRFIKYIFLTLLAILVIAITVGAPLLSEVIMDTFTLPEQIDDMALKVTVMPYVALMLAFVPVILDIIFERKKY